MAIAVVGMLDEREEALSIIRAHIEKRGHKSLLIDISIGTGAITSSRKELGKCWSKKGIRQPPLWPKA
jgi:hypothetical protein